MSGNFLNLIQIFWIAHHVVLGVLCLWIAIVVFRERNMTSWITLVAAILSPIFSLGGYVWQHLAIRNLSLSGMGTGNRFLEISQAVFLGHAVALLTFLIGLLLHLQRRKLETDRIAELETILHDLQKRQADQPPQPPR